MKLAAWGLRLVAWSLRLAACSVTLEAWTRTNASVNPVGLLFANCLVRVASFTALGPYVKLTIAR